MSCFFLFVLVVWNVRAYASWRRIAEMNVICVVPHCFLLFFKFIFNSCKNHSFFLSKYGWFLFIYNCFPLLRLPSATYFFSRKKVCKILVKKRRNSVPLPHPRFLTLPARLLMLLNYWLSINYKFICSFIFNGELWNLHFLSNISTIFFLISWL